MRVGGGNSREVLRTVFVQSERGWQGAGRGLGFWGLLLLGRTVPLCFPSWLEESNSSA